MNCRCAVQAFWHRGFRHFHGCDDVRVEHFHQLMNTGTQAAKEAGNMVDLDSNPTKLIEIVEIGKQMLMTRGSLTPRPPVLFYPQTGRRAIRKPKPSMSFLTPHQVPHAF
jgi:hypothetical protein